MKKKLSEILSENIGSLIGDGRRFSSNVDAERKTGVPKSTFDRLRNANKPGIPTTGVDKLEDIASALKIEPWQLIYPGLNINSPPLIKKSEITDEQTELIKAFELLGNEEKEYILKKIYSLIDDKSSGQGAKSA